jgi:hypothetical protein
MSSGCSSHVRFGSKADIDARPADVRFTSKSRHCLEARLVTAVARIFHTSHRALCQARLDQQQFALRGARLMTCAAKPTKSVTLGLPVTGSVLCACALLAFHGSRVASQSPGNVRFGSKADILLGLRDIAKPDELGSAVARPVCGSARLE